MKENPGAVDAGVQSRKLDTTTDRFHRSVGGPEVLRRWPPIYPPVPWTEHQQAAAEAAARHLLSHQLPPIFPVAVIRRIRKRDRELGQTLARIAGVG